MGEFVGECRTLEKWVRVAAIALCLCASAGVATADPVTFNLNYAVIQGTGSADGTFTIDNSLLGPSMSSSSLKDLLCFSVTVCVPGIPCKTFTKADLSSWTFATNASGVIRDANFFMDRPSCTAGHYQINGVEELQLGFFACPYASVSPSDAVSVFEGSPTEGGVCGEAVPTLSIVGLAALVLLLGGVALAVLKRGAVA
jgi:hypothetical protein